jgi:hypothetical protein
VKDLGFRLPLFEGGRGDLLPHCEEPVEGKGDLISSLFVKRAGGDLACPEPVEGKKHPLPSRGED